jgi:hypothetical protein
MAIDPATFYPDRLADLIANHEIGAPRFCSAPSARA